MDKDVDCCTLGNEKLSFGAFFFTDSQIQRILQIVDPLEEHRNQGTSIQLDFGTRKGHKSIQQTVFDESFSILLLVGRILHTSIVEKDTVLSCRGKFGVAKCYLVSIRLDFHAVISKFVDCGRRRLHFSPQNTLGASSSSTVFFQLIDCDHILGTTTTAATFDQALWLHGRPSQATRGGESYLASLASLWCTKKRAVVEEYQWPTMEIPPGW